MWEEAGPARRMHVERACSQTELMDRQAVAIAASMTAGTIVRDRCFLLEVLMWVTLPKRVFRKLLCVCTRLCYTLFLNNVIHLFKERDLNSIA